MPRPAVLAVGRWHPSAATSNDFQVATRPTDKHGFTSCRLLLDGCASPGMSRPQAVGPASNDSFATPNRRQREHIVTSPSYSSAPGIPLLSFTCSSARHQHVFRIDTLGSARVDQGDKGMDLSRLRRGKSLIVAMIVSVFVVAGAATVAVAQQQTGAADTASTMNFGQTATTMTPPTAPPTSKASPVAKATRPKGF
jgi:hypothetical protein